MSEAMAHPFYPPEDEVVLGQPKKSDALSIPHSIRGDGPQDLIDSSTDCPGSVPGPDGKGRNLGGRRRIQVAVSTSLSWLLSETFLTFN